MRTRHQLACGIGAVALAMLAACGGGGGEPGAPAPAIIRIDGSSTVFPITEAVAEEFQRARPGARVTVGISGTGGGFQKFCRGETDISDASRPITPGEIETCRANGIDFVELPVAYDGIVIVVNPENTWAESMTVDELRRVWEPEAEGTVTRWNQVRTGWPDRELHLFGPGTDSGTFDYFTEAIMGKSGASRGDFTSSEDDNVLVQGVAGDPLALGYFGIAYYEENQGRLKSVPIDDENPENGAGPITASLETVREGTYRPLSRPILIYVSTAALSRDEVRGFVDYYLTEGPALAQEVGYVPLTAREYELVQARLEAGTTGTMFGEGANQTERLESLLAAPQP